MKSIEDILLSKMKNGQLGHFYIISTQDSSNSPNSLQDWLNSLLQSYLDVQNAGCKLENHPDIAFFTTEKENYQVHDLSELFQMTNHRPLKLHYQFAIITEAHKLNENLSNKLLKILEEPSENLIIFLLNPNDSVLLPTVESRAIKLKIPKKFETLPLENEFIKSLESSLPNLHDFIDKLKNDSNAKNELIHYLINNTPDDFHAQNQLIKLLKNWQKNIEFHNYPNSNFYQAYRYLEKYINNSAP